MRTISDLGCASSGCRRQWCTACWAGLAGAALDDGQLARAVCDLSVPVPGLGRRSVPEVRAVLAGWAAAVHHRRLDLDLATALTRPQDGSYELETGGDELPPPRRRRAMSSSRRPPTQLRHAVARADAATSVSVGARGAIAVRNAASASCEVVLGRRLT